MKSPKKHLTPKINSFEIREKFGKRIVITHRSTFESNESFNKRHLKNQLFALKIQGSGR